MSGAWDKETLCQQLEAMSKQRQALIDALAALLDALDAGDATAIVEARQQAQELLQ